MEASYSGPTTVAALPSPGGRNGSDEAHPPRIAGVADLPPGAPPDASATRAAVALQVLGLRGAVVVPAADADDDRLLAGVLRAAARHRRHPQLPPVRAHRPRDLDVLPGRRHVRDGESGRERRADEEGVVPPAG